MTSYMLAQDKTSAAAVISLVTSRSSLLSLACLSTCCLVPVKRKSVVLVGAALACLCEKFRAGPSGFGPSEAPFAFGCRSEPGGV